MKIFNKHKNNFQNFKKILQHRNTAILITTAAALPLAGCMGIYEGGFECPAGTGVGCKSISEVNSMVNAGELPKSHYSVSPIETDDETKPCESCGHNSTTTQEKPEIWINPLYLKDLQKRHQEEPHEENQKEKPDRNQLKVRHGTISL